MSIYSDERIASGFEKEKIQRASELFKSIGDPTRLEILCLLLKGERQVGELAKALDHTQSAISHQLRLLRNLKIVRSQRKGKFINYSLDDSHIEELIRVAFTHAHET